MTEREIFLAAIAKSDANERAAYLESACSGDNALRRRLDVLLSAHAQAQEFLEAPPSGIAATIDRPMLEQVGAQIGPYKLLQKLGEGGFGVVYMAEQERPVRRMVALKIIKPGMDTREVIARFESERQALAIMDHPNIAKVLDAGATETGRPYFVMELVKGVPITDFCDRNHMPAKDRLALFVTACQAIQHAHHKGVIHRDIKPSNVMVTLHDGVPVVKVIDFGVAKATSQKLTEKTLFTAYGQMIGTPAYMSPEQAEMSGLDIDTRSDIYSLGVLLYELLTGTTPLDLKRLRAAGYVEMQRLIREEEAPRPSTRLSSLGGEASLLAGNRGTDPRRLAQLLAGDLDWIVMKALEKDRNRRYASPGSLAEDIDRFLHQEAILARPPSSLYRLKKYAQRNRVAVFLMLFVPATILAVLSNHIVGLYRTRAQRDRAVAAERLASERLTQVEQANVETKRALKLSESARQQVEVDRNRAVEAERVALANEQKARELTVDVIGLMQSFNNEVADLTSAYQAAGKLNEAVGFYERAPAMLLARLGPVHKSTYVSVANQAIAYQAAGKMQQAIDLFETILPILTGADGPGPNHPVTLFIKTRLAEVYNDVRNADRAIPLFEETVPAWSAILGPQHEYTLYAMNNQGCAYVFGGKFDKAIPLLQETIAGREVTHGRQHGFTLVSMRNLAEAYRLNKQFDESIALFEQVLAGRKTVHGPNHQQVLVAVINLSMAFQSAGKHERAISLLEQTLAGWMEAHGADDPDTHTARNQLAAAYRDGGRLDEAVKLFEETLRRTRDKFGPDHPSTIETMRPLGVAYQLAGRLDDSIAHRLALLPLMKAKYGEDHQETLLLMYNLAETYRAAKRLGEPEAIEIAKDRLRIVKAKHGPDELPTVTAMMHLAWGYRDSGQIAEAIPVWEEMYRIRKAKLGDSHTDTINVMRSLGSAYRQVGRLTDSLAIRSEALPLIKATQGANHNDTLNFMSNLATDYSRQADYARAEPLLLAIYGGLAQAPPEENKSLPNRTQIAERLAQLYQAWNKPDDDAKWRKALTGQ